MNYFAVHLVPLAGTSSVQSKARILLDLYCFGLDVHISYLPFNDGSVLAAASGAVSA